MEYLEKLRNITTNLEKCERVTRYSSPEENQSDTLANAFIDIEESILNILLLLPKFYNEELKSEEADDLILEIGEELRHLLYHINDTEVYNYLNPDVK